MSDVTSTNMRSSISRELRGGHELESIVGTSPAICEVLRQIVRIAATDATVLITGESGTGKELVANAIHANSKRANAPLVTVNCAALAETLLESELFGHTRDAFTGALAERKGLFEEADGGTLVLDEIAETTTSFQAKLLRALQEREIRRVGAAMATTVDVRIIASTNQDLPHLIQQKRFRHDLYHQLNAGRIALPPLRARREDIPLLAEIFVERFRRRWDVPVRVGDGVLDALVEHDFAGNVRELENVIGQAVALARDGVIHRDDLPLARPSASKSGRRRALISDPSSDPDAPADGAAVSNPVSFSLEANGVEAVELIADGTSPIPLASDLSKSAADAFTHTSSTTGKRSFELRGKNAQGVVVATASITITVRSAVDVVSLVAIERSASEPLLRDA